MERGDQSHFITYQLFNFELNFVWSRMAYEWESELQVKAALLTAQLHRPPGLAVLLIGHRQVDFHSFIYLAHAFD